MTEMRFLVGDVVRLLSGSPLMTVVFIAADNRTVGVEWMVDGEMRGHSFPHVALRFDVEESDA